MTPPEQLPVVQEPELLHPVLPHARPLYPEGKVTEREAPDARANPPTPPLAAGKKAGSMDALQWFTTFIDLKTSR